MIKREGGEERLSDIDVKGRERGGKRDYFILYQMDDEDMLKDFKEFYEDVFPEFEKFGEVIQFKV